MARCADLSPLREVLGGEGEVEEGVEPCARGGWADAAKGGKDDGEERALQLDAASEVLVVLLFLPAGEEARGRGGGGGDVGGEEGRRRGQETVASTAVVKGWRS